MCSGKCACIRSKWLYLGKMVVFGKSGSILAKVVVFGQGSCIRAKWLYLGRVVVFEHMWLYLDKVFVFGQKLLYFGKSCYIRSRWWY